MCGGPSVLDLSDSLSLDFRSRRSLWRFVAAAFPPRLGQGGAVGGAPLCTDRRKRFGQQAMGADDNLIAN